MTKDRKDYVMHLPGFHLTQKWQEYTNTAHLNTLTNKQTNNDTCFTEHTAFNQLLCRMEKVCEHCI